MDRYLTLPIKRDLERKIILLSGPRQVGKTTLSRSLNSDFQYLNWDSLDDRAQIIKKQWDRSHELIILDELHKMLKFKGWLKGIYDKEGVRPRLLVTGSARLDIMKKMGDSLAGRFFPYRLYPLDIWELKRERNEKRTGLGFDLGATYRRLISCSGFPEPYLEGDANYYERWARTHLDLILKQDLLELESIRNLHSMETLISLLQHRVGSTVSARSLAEDLQRDPKTVRNWLQILENLFIIFRVSPYHKNIARALTKEPKYYFFDLARVRGDEGVLLENFVALSLKKQLDHLADVYGIIGELHFVRTRDGEEIDFYIHWDRPEKFIPLLIEVKRSDGNLSKSFIKLAALFGKTKKIQLVLNLDREKNYPTGERVLSVLEWLADFPDFPEQSAKVKK